MMRDTHKAAEAELAGGRLFIAALPTPDVVSVEGSVFGGPNHVARAKEALPILAAGLLDAGTTKKRKDAFRGALSDRAAELSFFADGDRTYFSGRCFPEDLPFLLHAASESLTLAAFPEAEVRAAKARAAGNIREERSDTRAAAERALLNLLYDDAHVNHPGSLDAFERSVRSVRRPELLAFRKMLGTGGLVLSITGDLVPEEARAAADAAFKRLKRGTEAGVPKIRNRKMPNADVKLIPMRDKANVDVFLG
ncbi:MAG: insulinase family protein, partial [Patescibacteria group bacterium]|nr:insulinase family protein [Patescibacteria group bacterium]